eukprot:scaffold923_cov288-Pavlova_lutheri.AAC.1
MCTTEFDGSLSFVHQSFGTERFVERRLRLLLQLEAGIEPIHTTYPVAPPDPSSCEGRVVALHVQVPARPHLLLVSTRTDDDTCLLLPFLLPPFGSFGWKGSFEPFPFHQPGTLPPPSPGREVSIRVRPPSLFPPPFDRG